MCLPTLQVPNPHLPLPASMHTHMPIHLELSINGLLLWQWLPIVSNSMCYQLSHNICQVSYPQSRVHLRSTHSLISCHHICSYSVAFSAVSILVVPLCCGCCGYCTAGEFHEVVISVKRNSLSIHQLVCVVYQQEDHKPQYSPAVVHIQTVYHSLASFLCLPYVFIVQPGVRLNA